MNKPRCSANWVLLALVALVAGDVSGDQQDRFAQYRYPRGRNYVRPAATNQVTKPKPAEPAEKPQKFKDLALNAEFYFLADKDRRLFPRIKISNTQAKTVPTSANPTVTTNAVPAEALVIAKKESRNNDDKAGKDGETKRPSGTP